MVGDTHAAWAIVKASTPLDSRKADLASTVPDVETKKSIACTTLIAPEGAAAAGAGATPPAAAPPHGTENTGLWFTGAWVAPAPPSYLRRQLVSAIVMEPARDGTTSVGEAAKSDSIL